MKNAILKISVATLIVAFLTFLVAGFTFLASITSFFKPTIPIQFDFVDGEIRQQIELATGDPAKPIVLRFHNSGKTTLTGVVLSIRFYRPLALSGTKHAIQFIQGETAYSPSYTIVTGSSSAPKETTGHGEISFRGPASDNSYYRIQFGELVMPGDDKIDVKVELNTQNMIAGKINKVGVTTYSTQPDYKKKEASLSISMK